MLLFKEDWDVGIYQNAIVDYKTPNKSFLNYVGILESMGIENRFFPLALVHPELQGVDPHDPNLTTEEITKIVIECKVNPWYFFREVVRVPSQGSVEPVRLRANRGNIALWWCFFNHITSLLIQPRQTGKSLSTDCLMTLLMSVVCVKTRINLLTRGDSLRMANIKRIKDIMDELPPYLKLRNRKDTNNTETITINALENIYTSSVAQSSIKAAISLGRGLTVPIHHIDEIAFCENIGYTLPNLLATSTAARDNAKAAGAPYGNIFTTTCGYLNSDSGQYAKMIYDESLPWSEKLFDCKDEEDLYATIRKNNKQRISESTGEENVRGKLQILLEFNHRQLGYTDEWLRQKLEDAKSSGEDAKADFLNIWGRGNESSPISPENLEIINRSREDDYYSDISKQGYISRWYIDQNELERRCSGRFLIMSLDPSEAVGRDDIGMHITDAATGETIAAGDYNETNIITFANWIVWWLEEFPNLLLIPERKNMGTAIIDLLLAILPGRGIDPFKRIFNWVVDTAHEVPAHREIIMTPLNRRDPSVYVKYKSQFGYSTSGSGRAARDNLYDRAFNNRIRYTGNLVRDKKLINQLNNLVYRNGRIDHKPGEHDDLVICWLLGYWFLTVARNKDFYGLNSRNVLVSVVSQMIKDEGGEEAIAERERINKIKSQILSLKDKLRTTTNTFITQELNNRIAKLSSSIDLDSEEILNVDDITAREKEKRKISTFDIKRMSIWG